DGFRSTPELSFAVRDQRAGAGIVISASHNPPSDNGFKAYNSSGGQVIPEEGDLIIAEVKKVKEIKKIDYEQALSSGKIQILGPDVDERYYQAVINESVSNFRSATIVYSPIHGAGQMSTLPVLEKAGFDIEEVKEQMVPDGNFPNVADHIPNPEVLSANDLARDLLVETGRDLALTNDPDADRLAALVKTADGPVFLNGNQIATLVTYYVFSTLEEQGNLPKNGFLARTIVTTPLLDQVAKKYNLKIYNDLLVGFKYIGELIRQKQDLGDELFLLGGEESFGMLKGSYVRDKDGAVAALMLAEFASKLKDQGKTLVDALDDAYRAYGYYSEHLSATFFEGMDGALKKNKLMESLRDNSPDELAGFRIRKTSSQVQDSGGSFIVKYEFEGMEAELFIRPSGTEPKVKFYVLLRDQRAQNQEADLIRIKQEVDSLATKIDQAIHQLVMERV
ncbi:phospho-sugar mutase, partial [Candidatus Berkelbacteria bacterium]|nr:phospho-sugar mutase [Candidatus Berkelbacteria bacterium]